MEALDTNVVVRLLVTRTNASGRASSSPCCRGGGVWQLLATPFRHRTCHAASTFRVPIGSHSVVATSSVKNAPRRQGSNLLI